MVRTRLIIVGGFLGAGKTSLLWKAARRLIDAGKRVGLVTNDQAPDLVDTAFLREKGLNVSEVAGSCFCCNFQALIRASKELEEGGAADVVIAEPVGSCTDLSATILQPLKDLFPDAFDLSPLSVLADPLRLAEMLSGTDEGMHPDTAYIYRKQLEEADTILVGKTDLLAPPALEDLASETRRRFPDTAVRRISCLTGEGIDGWLAEMMSENASGRRIAAIDYNRYASGEAVLGWLNADVRISGPQGCLRDGRALCLSLMEGLDEEFTSRRAPVGHIKAMLSTSAGGCTANLTRLGGEIVCRGAISGTPPEGRLLLNARVEMAPDDLRRAVVERLERLSDAGVTVDVLSLQSLAPARPVPTHRYPAVAPSRRE